jgi:hypothetical protein
MFATGAAGNAEFATAMRKCFDNTDAVLATTSEGDDPSDGPDDGARMSYLATTATSVLHTTTPTTTVRLLLDSGASNHITNNVTLAESFNFKKLRRPGKAFGGSVAGHQMTATLSGTTDWAPGTTYYVPDSTANLLALGEYQARGWEIKSNGRNELILTPPQPSATPLIFKRQRNNLYVWDVDIDQHRHDEADGAPGTITLLPTPTTRDYGRGGAQARGEPLAEHGPTGGTRQGRGPPLGPRPRIGQHPGHRTTGQ